jgi:multiple sugar transport system permease protein
MTLTTPHQRDAAAPPARHRRIDSRPRIRRNWWGFGFLVVLTAVALIPIAIVVISSVMPGFGRGGPPGPVTLNGFVFLFQFGPVLTWIANSVMVTGATVIVAVLIGAPAGYALSRARGKLISGYAVSIFLLQCMPVIMAIVPLFILFAGAGLVDNLVGVTIIYVGVSIAGAIWMMAAYIDSIPISLEEAAWLDGCSVLGGFFRVVLRNSLPGVLSTAIFAFLLTWNDYLIVVVFIRSQQNYTLPLALESAGHSPALAVVMMVPPVLIFACLNRYFSLGGIGGALADR